jgi:hypothetical protein
MMRGRASQLRLGLRVVLKRPESIPLIALSIAARIVMS